MLGFLGGCIPSRAGEAYCEILLPDVGAVATPLAALGIDAFCDLVAARGYCRFNAAASGERMWRGLGLNRKETGFLP